ncbi:MAG: phosphatase PAP2 family protein [Proteobacteria bacterium]|nr:phosphatase PAP2 family protein [Pseudomonadota bacterium]
MSVYRGLKRSHLMVLLTMMIISFSVIGCGTLNNGRGWGQDALYPVDLKRLSRAAYNAFFDLQTLIPAAGALIFAVGDFDEEVSDWATKHNPIFGSEAGAKKASDYLAGAIHIEAFITALAAPSGDDPEKWAYSKAKGIGVELAGIGATVGTTSLLNEAIVRKRPDRSNGDSFPSGHSSGAFASATLANRNLNSIPVRKEARLPLQVGNIILATSVAWSRVEAQEHFPSDVLAGAALGYFLSALTHDTFLGLSEDTRFGLVILPLEEGAIAEFFLAF